MAIGRIYVAHPDDSVGTLLGSGISVSESVPVADRGLEAGNIMATSDIPAGHKIALVSMKPGDRVIKYGFPIGLAVEAIERGEHVHVHNIESERGRGDLAGQGTTQ